MKPPEAPEGLGFRELWVGEHTEIYKGDMLEDDGSCVPFLHTMPYASLLFSCF